MSAAMEHDLSPDINPLLARWTGPFEAPPFDSIKPSHFVEAFETALSLAQTEIDAIAVNPEAPSFENTIIALERSGRLLTRVSSVFSTSQRPIPMTRFKRSNARSLQSSPGVAAPCI
jgi:peptidyl-dipeptidase Dcp